jgi:membrane-associated protease RseP (regulator of RpoE activity)
MAQVDHLGQQHELDRRPDRLRDPPTLRSPVEQPAPAARADAPAARGDAPAASGAPTAARRMEQAIVRIDPRSMLNLSLGFYGRMLLIGVGLGVLLWLGALVTGTASSIDTFIEELTGYPSLTVLGFQGLLVAIVLGLVFVIGGAFVAVLAVVVFNMASDLGGGIKMTVMETELDEALMGRGSADIGGTGSSGPQPLGPSGRARRTARHRPVLGADVSGLTARTNAADGGSPADRAHRPNQSDQSDQRPTVMRGALVVGVEHDSPAHSAGLKAGDVIVSVDGTTVDSPASLSNALNDRDTDGPTDMSWVDQHGRYRTAIVRLGDRSA